MRRGTQIDNLHTQWNHSMDNELKAWNPPVSRFTFDGIGARFDVLTVTGL